MYRRLDYLSISITDNNFRTGRPEKRQCAMDGAFAAVTYVCQKRAMKYLDNLISEPGTQKISCLRNGRFHKMQQIGGTVTLTIKNFSKILYNIRQNCYYKV